MAEALAKSILPKSVFVQSAGVREGDRDPFVDVVMKEKGLAISDNCPRKIDDLEDSYFDLIITLAPEAHHKALELVRLSAANVEYWPTADPTTVAGCRDQIMAAYRDARTRIENNIRERFGYHPAA